MLRIIVVTLFVWMVPLMSKDVYAKETYFIKTNSVALSHNTWLVTFTVDFKPYEEHLVLLEQEIQRHHGMFKQISSLSANQSSKHEVWKLTIVNLMERGVGQFYDEYNIVRTMFDQLRFLTTFQRKRPKRALLPFMGSVLKSLFGAATEKELEELKDLVNKVAVEQQSVSHVVDESITLLNKTNIDTQVNREAIKQLAEATDLVNERLGYLFDTVIREITQEITFLELSSQIHGTFHLVNSAIRNIHFIIQNLCDQAMDAAQGRMSQQLISPTKFAHVLRAKRNRNGARRIA